MTADGAVSPIVVGIDGSISADEAAHWAAREASLLHTPLRLVTGCAAPRTKHAGRRPVDPDTSQERAERAAAWGNSARAELERHHPDLVIETAVVEREPIPTLIDESRSARLVVLGTRDLDRLSGLVIGSVTAALCQRAWCPVVVVRGKSPTTAPPADGPVTVGLDGSAGCQPALRFALRAASARQVPLVAVHAWSDIPLQAPIRDNVLEAEANLLLAEALAGWAAEFPDVEVRRVVMMDKPVHSLLEESENAQLLVVGSRGRGAFKGMLLGSTSQALLLHSTCPLAVVRQS